MYCNYDKPQNNNRTTQIMNCVTGQIPCDHIAKKDQLAIKSHLEYIV